MSALNLESRTSRMVRVIEAMADRASADSAVGKVGSKLRKALKAIDKMTPDQLAALLDVLEDGVPADFRHMLEMDQ